MIKHTYGSFNNTTTINGKPKSIETKSPIVKRSSPTPPGLEHRLLLKLIAVESPLLRCGVAGMLPLREAFLFFFDAAYEGKKCVLAKGGELWIGELHRFAWRRQRKCKIHRRARFNQTKRMRIENVVARELARWPWAPCY
ncbi:hypothetical protein TIFTF001_000694 [Ficus carica]|uniref:Uncharacterized protein n=1 Tax=Ficus carica TaxID=3494 RepID=A0AA87YWQ6_FICCA|nr:hypothetical protein TIFTF001_000694 [Ficus carica]